MTPTLPPSVLRGIISESSRPLDPLPTDLKPSSERLSGIRHLAFDIYGTLLVSGVGDIGNSAPADRGAALTEILEERGFTLPESPGPESLFLEAVQENQAKAAEEGSRQPEVEIREVWQTIFRRVAPGRSIPPGEIEEIALRFELAVNPAWPMPGLETLLERLSSRFPRFSIVSNAQFFTPEFFPALLGKTLTELHFDTDACVWSYQEREAKPSIRLFQRLLHRIGGDIEPKEVLYVGNDMLNDIAAAREAGLRTALFAGDRRSLRLRKDHPRCRGVEPDLVITALDQLPAFL